MRILAPELKSTTVQEHTQMMPGETDVVVEQY